MSTALHTPPHGRPTPREPVELPPDTYPFLTPADGALGRLDDYLVLRVLGTGGMGVVFLAHDLTLNREVALKVILPRAAHDETSRRYFLREARAMAALEHENVVPLFRVGEANGVLFLAMPVLHGKTLETWLNDSSRRPLADVLRIARGVCEGLAAAHAKGLVHRDIKPANVWLSAKDDTTVAFGGVKLLDFGLARPLAADQRLTATEFVVGTPGYLAPELIQGATPTPACDLFGLGALLYQCFAGEVPFVTGSPLSTMFATVTAEPVPLSARVPDLPAPVAELVAHLLAKNPLDRPATAAAVAARLRELEGDPTSAATEVLVPGRALVGPRSTRRERVWQALAALVALAGVALAVAPFVGTERSPTAGAEPPASPPDPLQPLGTFTGLSAPAVGAAYLPDGRTFVVLAEDGWAYEWHTDAPGAPRKTWRAHPERGFGLAVCPDGRVLTGGNDESGKSEILGWNADRTRADYTVRAGLTWTNVISVNRDGTRAVATGREGTAVVFDPRDGSDLPAFQTEENVWLSGIALSPDGTRAVSGSAWETFARVWDVPTATLLGKPIKLPGGATKATAYSPDGATVAVAGLDGPVRLWNVTASAAGPTLYGHVTPPVSLAFSPDGARVAAGGDDGTVRVWDVKTGAELVAFKGHTEPVWAVAFGAHGRQILSAGRDKRVFTWAGPR